MVQLPRVKTKNSILRNRQNIKKCVSSAPKSHDIIQHSKKLAKHETKCHQHSLQRRGQTTHLRRLGGSPASSLNNAHVQQKNVKGYSGSERGANPFLRRQPTQKKISRSSHVAKSCVLRQYSRIAQIRTKGLSRICLVKKNRKEADVFFLSQNS